MLISKHIGFIFGSDADLATVASDVLIEDEEIVEAHYICSVNADGMRQLILITESEEIMIQVTAQQASEFGIDDVCRKSKKLQFVQYPKDKAHQPIVVTVPLVFHANQMASIEQAMKSATRAG